MPLKTLNTLEDFEQLKKGQVIFVSDGTPEPPKHHTRKHQSWRFRNYKGFVHNFEYSAGRHEITVDSSGKGMMVMSYGVTDYTFQVEANQGVIQ